tara:strand:+ start:248 stop:673 length:426 start_codon:yes stop_codon:yes gene_type:complete
MFGNPQRGGTGGMMFRGRPQPQPFGAPQPRRQFQAPQQFRGAPTQRPQMQDPYSASQNTRNSINQLQQIESDFDRSMAQSSAGAAQMGEAAQGLMGDMGQKPQYAPSNVPLDRSELVSPSYFKAPNEQGIGGLLSKFAGFF